MRRPLTDDESLAWWRAAIAGKNPPIYEDTPHQGWFKRRLVKDGPWVPIRLWWNQETCPETGELTADAYICCDCDGKPADPERHWVSACAQPISPQEYDYLLRLSRYAKARAPREPLANPRQAIDLMAVPPPSFKPKRRRRP